MSRRKSNHLEPPTPEGRNPAGDYLKNSVYTALKSTLKPGRIQKLQRQVHHLTNEQVRCGYIGQTLEQSMKNENQGEVPKYGWRGHDFIILLKTGIGRYSSIFYTKGILEGCGVGGMVNIFLSLIRDMPASIGKLWRQLQTE